MDKLTVLLVSLPVTIAAGNSYWYENRNSPPLQGPGFNFTGGPQVIDGLTYGGWVYATTWKTKEEVFASLAAHPDAYPSFGAAAFDAALPTTPFFGSTIRTDAGQSYFNLFRREAYDELNLHDLFGLPFQINLLGSTPEYLTQGIAFIPPSPASPYFPVLRGFVKRKSKIRFDPGTRIHFVKNKNTTEVFVAITQMIDQVTLEPYVDDSQPGALDPSPAFPAGAQVPWTYSSCVLGQRLTLRSHLPTPATVVFFPSHSNLYPPNANFQKARPDGDLNGDPIESFCAI